MKLFYLLSLLTSISLSKECWIRVWDLDGTLTTPAGSNIEPYVKVCTKYSWGAWSCDCETEHDSGDQTPEWERYGRSGMCHVDDKDYVKMELWDNYTGDKLGVSSSDIDTSGWTNCRVNCHDSGESDWGNIMENDVDMEEATWGSNINFDYKHCCEDCH